MRVDRRVEEDGRNRSVVMFESFTELIDHNREHDHRSAAMNSTFYGAANMKEADAMARRGLPRDGVEAINLAHDHVSHVAGDLIRPVFDEFYDTSGSFVDMGRFVDGTPECMVTYFPTDEPGKSNIVTLIMNISYNCGISADAIKKNGQSMMALVEAIETCGLQAEIWADNHVRGSRGGTKVWARTAVKLKRAGEPFDVGMFMYALTHPSFLRSHIFNAMHNHSSEVRRACGIAHSGSYGMPVHAAQDMDDFPPYSIYIPVISSDSQAGKFVPAVLKQLGLVKADAA
ncbi:DUF7192 family protein [Mycolicibacterium sphagni]|uniref:DUF7192 domain-containing protein n=1 Tax=Mycolicibacterium sphagni TaxID=1786 RepID=A0A255DQX4_9MYCO|nr:hypothetical protein [Mycolicibacterium sphagni]OYN81756.1 hypothetical protein CG716_05275 [Mycolicibacterium sphagni]